ncbi:MAG: hypothetical protein II916_04115 [Oscillospiraceae bacterium]|nr:hypothetical protein [Oscillospiraceae bacterium]
MKALKKAAYFAYSLLFFAACAIPGAMLLLPSQEDGSAEKRQLAPVPSLMTEDGQFNTGFSSECLAYVSDHFGFRSQLVTADAALKSTVLGYSAEPKVTIGQDGWLYYTQTLNDATGVPTVSELGIRNIVYNLRMSRDYVESKGSEFIVAIVPNKASVYPQYLPYNYQPSGVAGNYGNLEVAAADAGLNWCDLHGILQTAAAERNGELIYHKLDTHWNNTGALIGSRAILDSTGKEYNDFSAETAEYRTTHEWEGDLQKMLFPDVEAPDEQHEYDIPFTYQYLGRFKDVDDLTINTSCETAQGSLLMFRDSFARAAMPYLSENFAAARYCRARPNPYYYLENETFDDVVMEIAERNIAWLQKEAPMHAAPEAEPLPAPHATRQGTLETAQNGAMFLQLYGTLELPDDLHTACDYVVTLTAPDGTAQSYLAYHCYEADLLGEEEIGDNGYSLYIPTENLIPDTAYEVTLSFRAPKQIIGYQLGSVTLPSQTENAAAGTDAETE